MSPIADIQYEKRISDEDARRLKILLSELDARGKIDDVRRIRQKLTTKQVFHTDSNGYFPRRDGKLFTPIAQQAEFIESNAFFSLLYSSRGGGKSAAGAQKALRKISKGWSGAVLNPDFENLKTSTWPEFREWIPWENVIPRHRFMSELGWEPHKPFNLAFTNGALVRIKGLKDPGSARGPNINWLWYDEAGRDVDGMSWQLAIASVRVGEEPMAWATTTPAGKFHWLYEFFAFEEEISEEILEKFQELAEDRELTAVFETSMEANMDNLDAGFIIAMDLAYPKGYLRAQEREGKFVSPEGSLGDEEWFKGKVLPMSPETVKKRIRYWDLAATEKEVKTTRKKKDPDETIGVLFSFVMENDVRKFYIEDQIGGRWGWKKIKETMRDVALLDGPFVEVVIEQEPGASGPNIVAEFQDYFKKEVGAAWKVSGHSPIGDKVLRAQSWFGEAANGQFWMVFGNWNRAFLDQLDSFPDVPYDDRVDAVSGARQYIAPYRAWKSVGFLHVGMQIKEEEKENEENIAV